MNRFSCKQYLDKNQFMHIRVHSHAEYLFKIRYSHNDYSHIQNLLRILSLYSSCNESNIQFLPFLFDGFLDAPYYLLSSVNFRDPCYFSRSYIKFIVPSHSIFYGYKHPVYLMLRFFNIASLL